MKRDLLLFISKAVRYRVKATISVDHRVSNGADIVPFRVSRAVHAGAGGVSGESSEDVGVETQTSEAYQTSEVFLCYIDVMAIHLINCFTCNARIPRTMKTGMVCLLIETNRGLVLVDTGLGLQEYSNPTWFTQFFRVVTIMPFDPNEAAVNRIKQLGFKPEDVKNIILTHMHFDHCSGLPDFPNAKVHVHKREYDAFTDGRILHWDEFAYIQRYIAHQPEFVLYEKIDSKWYDFDAIRLPFEPEMYFIPLFGHSRGQCGVAVKTSTGWFFHAADAGAVYNNEAPAWLIRWALGPLDPVLRVFMKSHPDVLITNSHMFPEFLKQYPTVI